MYRKHKKNKKTKNQNKVKRYGMTEFEFSELCKSLKLNDINKIKVYGN